jgi:hypothetical protein
MPAARVGAGSGVLATTHHVSLALGVSSLGGLFLAQQAATSLGALGALVLVLGALIVLNGVAAALSWGFGA